MIYLACIVIFFSGLQWLNSLVNLFSGRFLRRPGADAGSLVSVLIPARNEEKCIGFLLDDLSCQTYERIEILVFDDLSADNTAAIVAGKAEADRRIRLISSSGLPEGWNGKPYACHSLSLEARGEYFLFLDADVRLGPDLISNGIRYMEKYRPGLLSVFPRQIMETPGEWMMVPVMNYILLTLLPLILVRVSPFSSHAAANGQLMLFTASRYRELLPHSKYRLSRVEDIETARYFKRSKVKVLCLTGNDSIRCRMYNGFYQAVNGFSKNMVAFFGGSFILAVLFWLITTFGFLAVLLSAPPFLFLVYLALVLSTRLFVSLASRQEVLKNLLFIIPQQIAMGLCIYRAITNHFTKNHEWKGRNIS